MRSDPIWGIGRLLGGDKWVGGEYFSLSCNFYSDFGIGHSLGDLIGFLALFSQERTLLSAFFCTSADRLRLLAGTDTGFERLIWVWVLWDH